VVCSEITNIDDGFAPIAVVARKEKKISKIARAKILAKQSLNFRP
jgi:hypothetical protein